MEKADGQQNQAYPISFHAELDASAPSATSSDSRLLCSGRPETRTAATATTTVTETISTTTTTKTTIITIDLFIISNNVVTRRSEIFLCSMSVLHVKLVLLYAFQLLTLLGMMTTRLEPKLLL
jgi:hypothetical protein